SRIVMTLPQGTRVDVIREGPNGNWALVQVNGTRGYVDYVRLADIRTVPYYGTSAYPAYGSAYPTYETSYPTYSTYRASAPIYPRGNMIVNSVGGVVHQTPDARSPLLTTLPPGYPVSVVGSAGGSWAHVVVNGVDGYMDYSQLQ